MGNVETVPSHPLALCWEMDSRDVKPRETFAKIKAKPQCKVKVAVQKTRTVKKPIPAALKTVRKNIPKKVKCVKKIVKPKEIVRRDPSKSGFRKFHKDLQDTNPEISEVEILKRAAIAWCNMNERQRRRFLQ